VEKEQVEEEELLKFREIQMQLFNKLIKINQYQLKIIMKAK
jgi:hypothetical protein